MENDEEFYKGDIPIFYNGTLSEFLRKGRGYAFGDLFKTIKGMLAQENQKFKISFSRR
jgi:hypothetical protein